jgi:alpha-L-rhamnosidase
MRFFSKPFIFPTFLYLLTLAVQADCLVEHPQCNYVENPVGIDDPRPSLSWIISSQGRGEKQTAYQVVVASSPELLSANKGDLWDSGKVMSEQSIYIPYAGVPLLSRMRCFWQVRVWGKDGQASAWSTTGSWTMGLLKPEDWTARWITASKWFMPPEYRPKGLALGSLGGWAQVDLGASLPINSIKLYPLNSVDFPPRFKLEGADNLQFINSKILVDRSAQDYVLAGSGAQEFPVDGFTCRFVRLTIISATGKKHFVVRQMEVMSGGKNVALMKFAQEYGTVWYYGHAVFLFDGMPSQNDGATCPPDACPTTAAPWLRKAFSINKGVVRATLYCAALGMADVTLNGKKVGDEVLGPPFSDSSKRVVYLTHDITALVGPGENALGATLGNGFFSPPGRGSRENDHGGDGEHNGGDGPPCLLLQVEIEFSDGTRQAIVSDETWKWSRSDITFNDVWQGYSEDRRLSKPGWDQAGFDDSTWAAVGLGTPPDGKLVAPMSPPIRVLDELKPVAVDGNHAHFDVESAGWPRVAVSGKAGQTITISGKGLGFTLPKLSFTLAQDGPAVLEPRFVFFSGPTDLQVDGLTQPLAPDSVSIVHVNADLKSAGAFSCSNPYLNTLYEVTSRTHHNYDFDVPMDPSREKQGWTQDAQNMFDTAAYLTDVRGVYRRWWWDMADNQDSQGYLGTVIPLVNRQNNDWNSPWWSGVVVFLPWEHYQYYGDRRLLEEAYGPMCRYVDFLGKMAEAGYDADTGNHWGDYPYLTQNLNPAVAQAKMLVWNGAGDWINPYAPGNQHAVPTPLTTMPAWYYYATVVSRTATLLGKKDDAARYAAVAEGVKDRLNAAYFHPDTGLYGDHADSQTAQILPLAVGMVPADKIPLTYQRLLDAIHARKDHVGTGFVALPWLLQTLAARRESALANVMVNQKDYPSWNTLVKGGVLKESWGGGGVQMPSCGGAIGGWLFQSVLGIQPDPDGPGFKKFILAPQPDLATGLTSAQGYYDCPYGRITSEWKCSDGQFLLHATIPVNTTATVLLPTADQNSVLESGLAISHATGVQFLRTENNFTVYNVESGTYNFTAKQAP